MKTIRKTSLLAAFAVALLAAPAANAAMVIDFVTTGTFGSSGTSTFDNGAGVVITFNSGTSNVELDNGETSAVSFGQFDTSGTTNLTDQTVLDTFTLSILQTAPSVDPSLAFSGTVSGEIRATRSGLFLLITSPLVITSADGLVQYRIVNADNGIPGSVSIGAPQTNNGLTSVNGEVTLTAIPEPTAFALLGLGIPAVLLYRRRSTV
jgi:hypothetical protein